MALCGARARSRLSTLRENVKSETTENTRAPTARTNRSRGRTFFFLLFFHKNKPTQTLMKNFNGMKRVPRGFYDTIFRSRGTYFSRSTRARKHQPHVRASRRSYTRAAYARIDESEYARTPIEQPARSPSAPLRSPTMVMIASRHRGTV